MSASVFTAVRHYWRAEMFSGAALNDGRLRAGLDIKSLKHAERSSEAFAAIAL